MGTQDMLMMGMYMLMLVTISWVVGEYFQREKKIHEEKLIEYENVPETEDDEVYDNFAQQNESNERQGTGQRNTTE